MDTYQYFKLEIQSSCAILTWYAWSCDKHFISEGFLDLYDTFYQPLASYICFNLLYA